MTDPRDGVRKLSVTVTMRPSDDRWGGMFLGEDTLRSHPAVVGGGPPIARASPAQ
ncbi:MAG: hypothetical protein M9936_20385 [Caldilinea sp.]|nr:hypothetical protein [Caldilinea sp.]MCB0058932.1 hypothetical protein [Caldilineaceae bacterium]MCB9114023.1 hypothetical protein [Caldilineaceae bacterium]MCB9118488.1 hypothetical protein [Caldilineaceae bacterium]MCO5212062.1 hypothetical protein [Caldilinea sp.]